jgi:hypothetical protein
MNNNWRTNLGGAVSVLGTSLIGIGIVPQVAGVPSKFLTYTAVVGFVLSALGKSLTALFAADAASVKQNIQQITAVAAAVDKINQAGPSSDTAILSKPK